MKKMILIFLFVVIPQLSFANSWDFSVDKNAMTGEKSVYVSSPTTLTIKSMDFPYSKTKGWIGVGCKNGKQWAYFGFSVAPNLINSTTEDGYSVIKTKIKIGNKLEQIELTQKWGSKFLQTSSVDSDTLISNMKKANSVLLELDWHGNEKVYFEFSLKGSTKALNKMQKNCKYNEIKRKQKKDRENKLNKHNKKVKERIQKEQVFKDRCEGEGFYYIKLKPAYGCSDRNLNGLSDKQKCEFIGEYDSVSYSCFNYEEPKIPTKKSIMNH